MQRSPWYMFQLVILLVSAGGSALAEDGFPAALPAEKPDRPLSAAMQRFYDMWDGNEGEANELFTNFRYTELKGLDYNNHDGTVSRRDPSKVLKINGKYYVWYTRRHTPRPPLGPAKGTDSVPSFDWDLSEIWYATSEDGFTWTEQGVAASRPAKPHAGWRSVSTPDILMWKGKYYLYYQGFLEMPGKRGDYCPVTASEADSPDGPWRPANKIVVPNGPAGTWDQDAIHDPYPLIYQGNIYLYYKSQLRGRTPDGKVRNHMGQGLAIAEHPFGPFTKHPLNPVLNSGHETGLFPFRQGIAVMVSLNGAERNTIQYAPDGVNFRIASIVELMPPAPGPCVPDAFADNGDGRGITWGLCHFRADTNRGTRSHSILARFDCDLSLDVHRPALKRGNIRYAPAVYYSEGLGHLRKPIETEMRQSPDTIPSNP